MHSSPHLTGSCAVNSRWRLCNGTGGISVSSLDKSHHFPQNQRERERERKREKWHAIVLLKRSLIKASLTPSLILTCQYTCDIIFQNIYDTLEQNQIILAGRNMKAQAASCLNCVHDHKARANRKAAAHVHKENTYITL